MKDSIVASHRVYKFHNGIRSMHEWIRYHYRSRHTFQQVSYSGKLLPKKEIRRHMLIVSRLCLDMPKTNDNNYNAYN